MFFADENSFPSSQFLVVDIDSISAFLLTHNILQLTRSDISFSEHFFESFSINLTFFEL